MASIWHLANGVGPEPHSATEPYDSSTEAPGCGDGVFAHSGPGARPADALPRALSYATSQFNAQRLDTTLVICLSLSMALMENRVA